MAQKGVIRKDNISEYVIANGQEVRPYFGTQFNDGNKVLIHHFGGSTEVGVGLIGEANFRKGSLEGRYEVWGLSGVHTYGDPIPSKTLVQSEKLVKIRQYSSFMAHLLRNPFTIEDTDSYIAWHTGNTMYPFGNVVNLCYALNKCRKGFFKLYPVLWEPSRITTTPVEA